MISDAAAIVRARAFVRRCDIDTVPVDLTKYLSAANAEMRVSNHLGPDEAGHTMFARGRHVITVNGDDTPERQRFTVLHEVAHIVLELPSVHGDTISSEDILSHARRPPEEVTCDIFAAECLLPYEFLRMDLRCSAATFSVVETIATKYEASLACTASRIAVNAPFPCAYVLSQEGYVRFVTYSTAMRESRFWITPSVAVPSDSITGRCLKSSTTRHAGIVPAYLWTSRDEFADVDIDEAALVTPKWNQALTLISLDVEDIPMSHLRNGTVAQDEDEPLLEELDGTLRWSGRRRRR